MLNELTYDFGKAFYELCLRVPSIYMCWAMIIGACVSSITGYPASVLMQINQDLNQDLIVIMYEAYIHAINGWKVL